MKPLDERVAVVTGAASGVGRGIADVLAAEGARVAIADLDLAAAEEVAAALRARARAPTQMAVETDLTDTASVEAMAAAVA